MSVKEIVIKCTKCGYEAVYDINGPSVKCKYCRNPIIPKNYAEAVEVPPVERGKQIAQLNRLAGENPNEADIVFALGLFYLANMGYSFAAIQFRKAIALDPMRAEYYYYLAISLLDGKKPFSHPTATIREILENITLAEGIAPCGIYYYFHAFVTYDFFERKYLRNIPTSAQLKQQATAFGVTSNEITTLFNMLKIPRPTSF